MHGKQFHTNHCILSTQASSWRLCYCVFQKHVNSKVEKANCRFAIFSGPLRKQNFTLTGSKGHGLWFVIGEFRSVSCVSLFQGSLLVIMMVIMIEGSKKRIYEGCFWTLEFACFWKAQWEECGKGISQNYVIDEGDLLSFWEGPLPTPWLISSQGLDLPPDNIKQEKFRWLTFWSFPLIFWTRGAIIAIITWRIFI